MKPGNQSAAGNTGTLSETLGSCARNGLFRQALPSAYGGLDNSFSELVNAHEELGRSTLDPGLILSTNAHLWGSIFPLVIYGSSTQKQWIEKLIAGEWIGGHAITEVNAGSDLQALEMEAVETSNGFCLNGQKTFISNAPIADLMIVYARLGDQLTAFVVFSEDENADFGDAINLSACRTSPIGRVNLSNCRIPKSRQIGKAGAGGRMIQHVLEHERAFIFAGFLGIMDWQLSTAVDHSRLRRSGGSHLGQHQAISHKIADMKIRLDTSRLWIRECARLKDSGKRITMASAQTKVYAAEAFLQSSLDAVRIFGAGGLAEECRLSTLVQDALASRLFSGSSEIQKNIIAALLGTGDGFKS